MGSITLTAPMGPAAVCPCWWHHGCHRGTSNLCNRSRTRGRRPSSPAATHPLEIFALSSALLRHTSNFPSHQPGAGPGHGEWAGPHSSLCSPWDTSLSSLGTQEAPGVEGHPWVPTWSSQPGCQGHPVPRAGSELPQAPGQQQHQPGASTTSKPSKDSTALLRSQGWVSFTRGRAPCPASLCASPGAMWGQAGRRRRVCKPQRFPPGTAPEDVDLLPPRHAAASLPALARPWARPGRTCWGWWGRGTISMCVPQQPPTAPANPAQS